MFYYVIFKELIPWISKLIPSYCIFYVIFHVLIP